MIRCFLRNIQRKNNMGNAKYFMWTIFSLVFSYFHVLYPHDLLFKFLYNEKKNHVKYLEGNVVWFLHYQYIRFS